MKAYEINTSSFIWLTLVYSLSYIPLNFPSNYLMDKVGLWVPTQIACVASILGAWIRLVTWDNQYGFVWILIGQSLSSVGQAFTISGPPKVANVWFGDKERALCVTIGSLAIPVGCIISLVLPSVMLPSYPNPTPD